MSYELVAVLAAIEAYDLHYPARYGLVLRALGLAHALGYPCGIGWDDKPDALAGYRAVVYIDLPTGQTSWHMPEYSGSYDGHSTAEKYARCRAYGDLLAARS